MKPLLFPFTYVTEPAIDAFRSFFSGISVFQPSMKRFPEPMRQWLDSGFLDVILPDPDVSQMLDKIVFETENWAQSQSSRVAPFLKGYRGKVPFFEPTSVSQIAQDIRAAGRPVSKTAPQQDADLQAGLFLQLAQEFDAHNQWLCHQMLQHEARERDLYRELSGDAHSTDGLTEQGQACEQEDPFQYMLLDRLKAWSRVMLSHGHVKGPLVTNAAAVPSLIQEHVPDNETLILAATIPSISKGVPTAEKKLQALADYCRDLMRSPMSLISDSGLLDTYPAETSDTLCMQLYLLPGLAPHSFFSRFVEGALPVNRAPDVEAKNTLIGCIHKTSG